MVCILLLWVPLFLNYYTLMQADLLKSGQTYEGINLETLSAGQKTHFLFLTNHPLLTKWTENQINHFNFYSTQLPSFGQNSIQLRC